MRLKCVTRQKNNSKIGLMKISVTAVRWWLKGQRSLAATLTKRQPSTEQ